MYGKALIAAVLSFVLSVTLGACNVPKGETENLTEEIAKIAFASGRSGNYDIYLMDTDGSNQINLTNNPAVDVHPSWSPDSSKITFTSDRDGNYEIYVMDSDGSNQTNLTNNPATDRNPSWSPIATP